MSELIRREDAINAVETFFKDAYIEDADVHCTDMVYEINHIPTASPWRGVEEPPEVGQNVLTMDANEDMETATYDGEGFEDSYGFYVTDVLCWMPIEPPKESNED